MKGFAVSILAVAGALGLEQASRAQSVVWHQPAPVFFPAPVVHTVASPVVVAPMPVTRVHRPAFVGHQRTPYVVTRRRPILGGTVSRVRYRYHPVIF